MISWSDTGIVVTTTKRQEKYQAVEIFTKDHGMVRALCDSTIRICGFSWVSVDWRGRNSCENGFWRIQDIHQPIAPNSIHSVIGQRVCYLLHISLPYGDGASELFEYIEHMSREMRDCSSLEALNMYAYFEFLLLKSTGYGFDLKTCGVCGNVEKIEYISRDSGRGISRECRGITRDRLFRVPEVWENWSNLEPILSDLKTILLSISITNYFIEKSNLGHSGDHSFIATLGLVS
ncbi:MAG: DNA repair protein RecO C-terminal domain-containing protein [Holosporales bacterium]|jgi:DNA repair protein RecO (recombination protein O)|nr:DNA repair protein RecO C-terminal domain-containing protein [Holosporales bacterium]